MSRDRRALEGRKLAPLVAIASIPPQIAPTAKAAVSPQPQAALSAEPEPPTPVGFSRCKVCKCLVSAKRLDGHIARVHKQKRKKKVAAKHAPRDEQRSRRDPIHDVRTGLTRHGRRMDYSDPRLAGVVDMSSRQLDATAGTHVIRDHGQFGSAPSYDDMGDESRP